ncbi:MAG: efflux RND transporter periplasmic adaptor subunit [Armatimonadota bacterium]
MKKVLILVLIIAAIMSFFYARANKLKPAKPQPTKTELWEQNGVPVVLENIIKGDMEHTIEVTGNIQALDKVELSAKIGGKVAKVNFREGDTVKAGDVVIVLDQEDARSQLEQAKAGLRAAEAMLSQAKTSLNVVKIQTDAGVKQAEAGVKSAEARLEVVKNPARSQELQSAKNEVASAKASYDVSKLNYDRQKKLLEEGAISQAMFDITKAEFASAETRYNNAKEMLSMLTEGGRREDVLSAENALRAAKEDLRTAKARQAEVLLRNEDVKSAQAGVESAKAAVKLAQQQLSYTYVKSPITGKLSMRNTEPGQVIGAGMPLGEVVALNTVYFEGELSEKELLNVKNGNKVKVKIDAITGRTFDAYVDTIFPTGSISSRNFPVRIIIEDNSYIIKPGMFARGNILASIEKDVMLVPKDAIELRQGSNMVFRKKDNKAERIDVKIIAQNAKWVQIEQPTKLKIGDRVVTRGKQAVEDGSLLLIEKNKL